MNEAYKYANNHKYDYFTTIMSISRRKNADWLNEIGEKLQLLYPNTKYLYADFKKADGITENEKMNKIFKTYRAEITNAFHEGLKTPKSQAKDVLKSVATMGETEMRKTIMTNDELEPNAPLTIEIKGFDYPLFKTGSMMRAIKGKVSKI